MRFDRVSGGLALSLLMIAALSNKVSAADSADTVARNDVPDQHTREARPSLVIGTWGGPYEAAQRAALFAPFEQRSDIRIETIDYTGGLQILAEDSPPDLLDMLEEEAETACSDGLLHRINHEQLLESDVDPESKGENPSDVDAFKSEDFHTGVFAGCSVAHLTYSMLIAYDERAFGGQKPSAIADLFDLKRFPGKRALQRSPAALFEWALMAEGVPISQIYDLLSTERGLRLVLRRLDSLRGQILWWDKPAEAVAMLENGDVAMASGYNGRFFDAWSRGVPINMIWDGQIIDRSVWAMPVAANGDPAITRQFLRFALHPQRLAHMARQIPYGPLRNSAFSYIGLNPKSGIVMRDHLPTASHHLSNALHRDTHWYARTRELRRIHFDQWINAGSPATE